MWRWHLTAAKLVLDFRVQKARRTSGDDIVNSWSLQFSYHRLPFSCIIFTSVSTFMLLSVDLCVNQMLHSQLELPKTAYLRSGHFDSCSPATNHGTPMFSLPCLLISDSE